MRTLRQAFAHFLWRHLSLLLAAIPLSLHAQYGGPVVFDNFQDFDHYFKQDSFYESIAYNVDGYLSLQGSPAGLAVYDSSATGGSEGNGGTGGADADNYFDDVIVSAQISSSGSSTALFRAGYLLRLNDDEREGYLARVTSGAFDDSVIFEIYERSGFTGNGIRIFYEEVFLDSITLEKDTFYLYKVSLVDGTFEMDFANGEATATFTDTNISATQGQVGFALETANPNVQINLDNFSATAPPIQEEALRDQDFGSGAGQSFFLPAGETIYAIELYIERGDGSVELNLWKTRRISDVLERASNTAEATGTLLKQAVEGMPAGWFRITLDQPYTNNSSIAEELVFDLELLTSGSGGWNDYGLSYDNPYPFGSRVYWYDAAGEYEIPYDDDDLAFRAILNNSAPPQPPQFAYSDYMNGVAIDSYLASDRNVVIPDTLDGRPVLIIRKEIFYETEVDINSVTVPDSVELIETGAFTICCNQLQSITVAGGNSNYSSLDGVLFNKAQTSLLRCPDAKTGNYIIPNTVTLIDSDAFRYCTQLTGVQIPEGVTRINSYAFYACNRVTSLILPSTLERIGASAFAFMGITSITIPANLTRLETRAFQSCSSLETVTFEFGVESISSYVFTDCTSLKTIHIPSTVTAIGAFCFYNCTELEAIFFEGVAPNLVNTVFGNNSYKFGVYYPAGQTGYTGDDWNALSVHAYTGPTPSTNYTRWLARQQLHTGTSDEGIIPSTSYSYFFGYALNLDLSQDLPAQLPSVELNSDTMHMNFFADGDGTTYLVKASTDLVDWDTVPVVLTDLSATGTRTATVDISAYDQCFMQIEIQKAE